MNTQSSSMKTWIIGIVIVALGGAYFYFSGSTSTTDTIGGVSVVSTSPSKVDETQVLSLLNQVRSLHIDVQLFSDPAYTELTDFSVAIPEKAVGRPNPFAPLPGEASKSKTPTTPAKGR